MQLTTHNTVVLFKLHGRGMKNWRFCTNILVVYLGNDTRYAIVTMEVE